MHTLLLKASFASRVVTIILNRSKRGTFHTELAPSFIFVPRNINRRDIYAWSPHLIGLHWRVLDHHALHLVAHIALLVASESEVGGWLHTHYGLVAGCWVWHHGLVHYGKERDDES